MANAKISDDAVFIPETTNVRLIDGLAGYKGSDNAKITGDFLVQSVINGSGSGVDKRVTYYAASGGNVELAGSDGFTWSDDTTNTLSLGLPGNFAGNLIINSNHLAGTDPGTLTFSSKDGDNFQIYAGNTISAQTWILPGSLPSNGEVIKAAVTGTDVSLFWDKDENVTYDLGTNTQVGFGEVKLVGSDGTTDLLSLTGTGTVSVSSDAAGAITINGAAGSASAFTTLTAADVIDWDYATDGPNIKVTLGAGLENVLTVDTIGEFPDGSEGWMILDPSASVDYRLPDEDYGSAVGLKSVITSGNVSLDGTNPVLFHYTYDGTQFWWTKFVNMIEPANYPPSVNFDSSSLIFYHDPAVFNQATTGVVGPGDTVENMVGSALIGDLVTGSTVTSQNYYPKGNAEPFSAGAAFYSFGNTANRITRNVNIAVPISTEVTWSGYIQGPYNLGSSFQTLFDFDGGTDYDQQLYIDNGEFNVYQKGTFNYPVLDDYTATGGADLSNAWLFVSLMNTPSTGPTTNDGTVRIAVGCQASLDAAVAAGGATNWDYDGTGNTVAVDANGLYFESITNLDLDEFNFENFVLGNGRNGALNEGGIFHYGLFGIFNTVISDVVIAANWTSTRDTYGIT